MQQQLPGLRERHLHGSKDLVDEAQGKLNRLWIGSKSSLRNDWVARKDIQAVVIIGMLKCPKIIAEDHEIRLVFTCTGSEVGWKEFLKDLPRVVKFLHKHYNEKKQNVLIASNDEEDQPFSRQVIVVVAYLLLKHDVSIPTALTRIASLCYYYRYKDGLAKHRWIEVSELC